MKKFSLFILLSVSFCFVSAQTVENIQVEQNGEKLNINYRIGGSTSEQLYFVTLTCSIDGGPVFEPKSVIGDVGSNIRGGKSYNTIVWNVFNDVDEVGDVEFYVKVDLEKDERVPVERAEPIASKAESKPVIDVSDYRKINIGYSAGLSHFAGIRMDYLNNWGGYASIRYGGYDSYVYEGFFYEGTLMSINAGVTKRILDLDAGRLYIYLGAGFGELDLSYNELDLGLTFVIKNRFTISLGASSAWPDLTYGAGIVF